MCVKYEQKLNFWSMIFWKFLKSSGMVRLISLSSFIIGSILSCSQPPSVANGEVETYLGFAAPAPAPTLPVFPHLSSAPSSCPKLKLLLPPG